ncbi:MAG: nicotinic acid mononucleotide adenyltransferase [Bacteroidota bacterium]
MKQVIIIFSVLFSMASHAQDTKPVLERVGNMMKATYYHDNGTIAQTGHLLKGKLHGTWFMYAADGKKIASGKYVNGLREGKWFFWQGAILKEVDFENNKIAAVKNWDRYEVVATGL